ncbi:MAG: oxidoreductase [Burkholderiales bacterium]|nr:oxidoreductase [Burkholderiales bacterium]
MNGDDHDRPPRPRKPDLDECCGNGCDPCVFDRYDDALVAWERACREIEAKAKERAASTSVR